MTQKTLLFAVLILGIATLAQAQPSSDAPLTRTDRWDLSVQARYIGSQETTSEGGSSLSFQDNLGWGLGFHYNFNQQFSLGMDFSMHSIKYTALLVDGEDSSHTETYSNNLDVAKFGVVGTWNVLKGPFTPYLNGTLSWTMIDTNINSGVEDGCYWDPYGNYICGPYPTTYEKDVVSYSFGVGGRFELSKLFFVRVGYEYADLNIDAVDGQHLMRIDLGILH